MHVCIPTCLFVCEQAKDFTFIYLFIFGGKSLLLDRELSDQANTADWQAVRSP